MRRAFLVLIVMGLLIPAAAAQPYVLVFQGRMSTGESLNINGYTLTIVQAANGTPYIMLKNGSETLELRPFTFGTKIEQDGIKILLGSYTEQGGFVRVSVKPDFVTSLKPEIGAETTVNGSTVKVVGVSNGSVSVSINGVVKTLVVNGSTVVDLIAVEYTGRAINIYRARPVSQTKMARYSVFYPYQKIKTSGPVDVPITITSNSNSKIELELKVLNLPEGWSATFIYSGVQVENIDVPPKGSVTLTLHIEPAGSGTVLFSIGNFIGKMEIENAGLKVSIPYFTIEAKAGENITVPITLTGTGRADFQPKEVPEGWEIYLTNGQYRLRSFEVRDSFTGTLIVAIPRNATLGDHELTFTINGRQYRLGIHIYKTYLGLPARLTVRLTDQLGNPLKGWVAVGDKNLTTSPSGSVSIELPAGEYNLTAGAQGALPERERVKLEDGEEKSIKITLTKAPYYFSAELQRDVLTVQAGATTGTEITVTNLGSNEDEYRVTVEGLPNGWSYTLSQDMQGTTPVGVLKANPGKSVSAYLVIIAPFNVVSEEINAKVVISGKNMKIERTLTIKVENPASLRLRTNYPTLSVRAGGSTATSIWVDSMGTTVTNVKFSVQAPSGWEVEVIPDTIPRIGPIKSGPAIIEEGPQKVELRIKVPKSAPAGTYTITVTATGDQTKASTVVTVRVTRSSSSAYLGILLLLAVFGIVIWLMRRVGRR